MLPLCAYCGKVPMNRNLLFSGLVLIFAALACNLPGRNELPETPSALNTPEAHLPEETLTPTESTPIVLPTEEPESAQPIIYADRLVDPPELVFLDPFNGDEIERITAPELGYGLIGGATDTSVFYVDEAFQQAYRLLFDGSRQVLDFLIPEGEYFDGVILPSPDGSKVAYGGVLSYDPSGDHVQLKVVNVDGTEEQILVDAHLTDRLTRPTPIKWTDDGQYLFYMNVFVGVGGYGGTDLYSVEIATGESQLIFPDLNCLCSTSVSPDNTKAVRAVMEAPLSLVIKDVAAGTEETIHFPPQYVEAWEMVWAPDSSTLLVTLGMGNWEDDRYSLARINMDSLEMDFLITDDDRLLRPAAWHVMETIWLNDRDGNLWRMDAESLEMTLIENDARLISYSR